MKILLWSDLQLCFRRKNSSTTEQVTHWVQHDKGKHLFMSNSACEYLSPRHAASENKNISFGAWVQSPTLTLCFNERFYERYIKISFFAREGRSFLYRFPILPTWTDRSESLWLAERVLMAYKLVYLTPEGPNKKCNPPGANGVSNAILFRWYKTEWL